MNTLLRKNEALFILPIALLPFVVLIFYILGGGQAEEITPTNAKTNGANIHLPDADQNIEILDKQEAYMRQEKQEVRTITLNVDTTSSLSIIQLQKNLSEEQAGAIMEEHMAREAGKARKALHQHKQDSPQNTQIPSQERRSQSNSTKQHFAKGTSNTSTTINPPNTTIAYPLNNYEELHTLINDHAGLMQQNDSLIMQLEQARNTLNQYRQKEKSALKVETIGRQAFGKSTSKQIRAQVLEDSKVISGHRLMLRLMDDVWINNQKVKAGTLIYGLCKTSHERLHIQVMGIPSENNHLSVQLSAYDMDGIKGLYVPDNTARKVYKDVVGSTNPSVLFTPDGNALSYMGMNAANDAARAMLKRVRQQKVQLRKNTIVILKNE